jgi:hypothetical protein
MKQIERDLLALRMVNDYLDESITEIIPNYDKNKVSDLFTNTFKNESHIKGILTKLAAESYSRIEKKFPKQ